MVKQEEEFQKISDDLSKLLAIKEKEKASISKVNELEEEKKNLSL